MNTFTSENNRKLINGVTISLDKTVFAINDFINKEIVFEISDFENYTKKTAVCTDGTTYILLEAKNGFQEVAFINPSEQEINEFVSNIIAE